ncbi:hypothetical protein [Rhizobium sp. PDO1-076]|uniref:hypothetical protein n=1 Tax=Rhizobium sp. PDO1-076 TaxID=1125979 RepID=UPI0002F68D92|nr:hypothetical protein [Rhizobium sp. PDO1-076]
MHDRIDVTMTDLSKKLIRLTSIKIQITAIDWLGQADGRLFGRRPLNLTTPEDRDSLVSG